MGLDVIGAGFGRTGTLSLKAALEKLGFGPCYHMVDVFQNPDHVPHWDAAARGETVDWDALLEDYRSTANWPGCTFYREFAERWPEAKVVLGVRDPGSWYESVDRTIFRVIKQKVENPQPWRALHERLIWQGTFGGRFADKAHAIAVFERHFEEVKTTLAADRLLVFDVKEGWKPLCDFLGVTEPVGPFPHFNDRESFEEIGKRLS